VGLGAAARGRGHPALPVPAAADRQPRGAHRRDRPIPHLGELGYRPGAPAGRPAGRQYNSAQRLRAVWDELTVPGPAGAAVARLGGPVLLVDDRVESGWTMTVAAKLVREAGAPAVLPLALAVTTG